MRRRRAILEEKAMCKYVRRVRVDYGGMPTGSGGYRQEVACSRNVSRGVQQVEGNQHDDSEEILALCKQKPNH